MDANGTRFHLLLGKDDWMRCAVEQGRVEWHDAHAELTLARRLERFVAPPADDPVHASQRRGVAGDRHGNIYFIDAAGTRVMVLSSGTGAVSEFWPSDRHRVPSRHGDFDGDQRPAPPQRLSGAAVSEDHFLAIGVSEPPGLLAFDLLAGGAPIELAWPDALSPVDMAPRPGCGVWLLDGASRYWALDRGFGVVANGMQPAAELLDDFQPAAGDAPRRRPATNFPTGHPLDASSPTEAVAGIAIEGLPGGEVLILDAAPGQSRSRVLCYRDGQRLGNAALLDLGDAGAHDFVFVPDAARGSPGRLLVASSEGNQAFAYRIMVDEHDFHLVPLVEFHPMRRFGGRGLVLSRNGAGKPQAFYDCGDRWVPLLPQHRPRHETDAEILTPVFDSRELDCAWHRLMLDACVPPGSRVDVWTRAGEATDGTIVAGSWRKQPDPYLRGGGHELPWAARFPLRADHGERPAGDGTWELLFQEARGRYLQVKLVIAGDGRVSPRLRALRAWYPRYSLLERYLPALYRDEPSSSSFFERFLANFEGTFTGIEDRIASVHALFDVRSAPADALDWLADWFGVAMDPAWEERNRRLFIAHAMDFFQYRGTLHGLKMALRLAFDRDIDERDLGPPSAGRAGVDNVRVVENYLLRRAPGVVFGQPDELSGPRVVAASARWSPSEGNAGLVRRYREYVGADQAKHASETAPFPLAPPGDDDEAAHWPRWQEFVGATLGLVPAGGAGERKRWQQYLAARHGTLAAINSRHGTAHATLAAIALPADEPLSAPLRDDWREFVSATQDLRETLERARWQDFLARRHRRIESLNAAYETKWSSFAWIALPDRLPRDGAALHDWVQFELQAQPMYALAHTFRVLLPTPPLGSDPVEAKARMDLAQRIVDLEKPAHTAFDVRFFWAMFRIGDARLGSDTLLGNGIRDGQLLPDTVVGQSFTGTSFVAGARGGVEPGRMALPC